ncbi:MAG: hypothetical protein NUV92_10490 [Ignavibacteria bacterium]|jgi:hypothetical protein|nr:hypothetical protein [Ignavibacteria bacterium]MDH7527244.1 hypothetical protein [Ignavibacteria bacterium]
MSSKRFSDDDPVFEKIRRKRKEFYTYENIFSREEVELMKSQVFGSIHTIDDSKIRGFHEKDNYSTIKIRPGVVITSPSKETNFETEWVPMSSKIYNRNLREVVFLERYKEDVVQDSVILLRYRGWYKFKTLSKRKGKLSYEKQKELIEKLNKINF